MCPSRCKWLPLRIFKNHKRLTFSLSWRMSFLELTLPTTVVCPISTWWASEVSMCSFSWMGSVWQGRPLTILTMTVLTWIILNVLRLLRVHHLRSMVPMPWGEWLISLPKIPKSLWNSVPVTSTIPTKTTKPIFRWVPNRSGVASACPLSIT